MLQGVTDVNQLVAGRVGVSPRQIVRNRLIEHLLRLRRVALRIENRAQRGEGRGDSTLIIDLPEGGKRLFINLLSFRKIPSIFQQASNIDLGIGEIILIRDLTENGQRLLPHFLRTFRVTLLVQDQRHVVERGRFRPAITDLARYAQFLLVLRQRAGIITVIEKHLAGYFQRAGQTIAVADRLIDPARLVYDGHCILGIVQTLE